MPVFICQGCGAEHESWSGKCPECGTSETIRLAPNTDRMVDRVIKNKFRVLKKLGQGGMGAVYLAEQLGIGHKVALKFLRAEFSTDAEIARRFLNEAKSYARVAHPNAVALHDFGQDEEGNLFIAMEYCEGVDLKKLLAQAPLPMIESIDVVLQVADVLANAHEKGVIHRDLKPENIMVRRGLRGLHAKVLDFGIARLMDAGTRLTVAGAIAGTPRYMSPEQVEGKEVDLRADIYSLGIVLFELLTGKQPFDGSTIAEILRKQAVEPMPHLTEFAPSLDYPELDRVIQRACCKRREERWPDMLAFATALSMATPTQADLSLSPLRPSGVWGGGTPKPTVPDAGPLGSSGVAIPGQRVESSSVEHTRLKTPAGPEPVGPEGMGQAPLQLGRGPGGGAVALDGTGAGAGVVGPSETDIALPPASKTPFIVAGALVVLVLAGVGLYALRPSPPPGDSTGTGEAAATEGRGVEARGVEARGAQGSLPEATALEGQAGLGTVAPGPRMEGSAQVVAPGVAEVVDTIRQEVQQGIKDGTLDSFYMQGAAHFESANLEGAQAMLEKVPEGSRYGPKAKELLERITTIRLTLARANAERARGRPEEAIVLYQQVLKLNPRVKPAQEGLGAARQAIIQPVME